MIPDFFRILLQSGVTVNTCIAFGKAIISLYKFVESQLVGAAGVARNVDIGKALSIIQKQYKLLTRELRKNVSLAGIAARPKRKEGASYCVTRAIVEHEKVDRRVETIMEDFEKKGTISHCDYTFVMGIIARHEIEEAHAAEKRFFLLYGGRETGTGSVRSTLTRFFSVIGCGDYVISCNTTRHSTAGLQFNAYVEAVIDGLEPAVKEIAQLAGHQQQTQLRLYNDNFADACVKAYQKLKQFADDEAKRFKDDVNAARKSVTIISQTQAGGDQIEEEEVDEDDQLSSETSDTEDEGTLDPGYALPSTPRANRNDRNTVKSVRELRAATRAGLRSSSQGDINADGDPYEFREEDPAHEHAVESVVRMASSSKPSSFGLTRQEQIGRGSERTVVIKRKKSKAHQAEPTLRKPHAQLQNTTSLQSIVDAAEEEIQASSGSSSSNSMQQDIESECRGISLHEVKDASNLLQWVAEKSGLRHLVLERSKRHECFDAYAESANVLGVRPTKEIFPHCVVIPFAGANQLCKLLWAAHHDAFSRGGTVVLMLESLIPARQATVLVLGRTIQADEPRTFSSCVAFELRCESGDVGRCVPVRIGEMAKLQLPEMERRGDIPKLPVKLSDGLTHLSKCHRRPPFQRHTTERSGNGDDRDEGQLEEVNEGDGSQAVFATEMRPSATMETRRGSRIATSTLRREQLYMERNDARYTGDETVHPLFKTAPDTNSMFEWQNDYITSPPYYLQRFQMIPSSSRAEPPVEEPRHGLHQYAQYVERYMLATMRSRGRYGEPISIDDALFSYEIASEFFARTKRIGVPVENRIGFAKALTKFFNFLNIFMDSGEEGTPYCAVRAILDHHRIDEKINSIMQGFESGELIYIDYNYVMSARMAYIVHSNAARNEVVYKVRYGSFYASTTATGEKVHGLHEERFQIGQVGNRKPIYKGSACFYLRKFFADSKCAKFVISCNTTRHRAAEQLYSRYWREQLQALRYDADALSQLQGHDAETLLLRYNRDFVKSAVYAYVKLRRFADEDANNHVSLIASIQEKVLVEDLASINEERAADEATHRIDLGAEEAGSDDQGAGEDTEGVRSSEERSDDGDERRTGSGLSSPGQEAGQDDSAADLDDQAGPSGIAQQVGRAERTIEDRTDAEEAAREAGHVASGIDLLQARYGLNDQPGPSELAQERKLVAKQDRQLAGQIFCKVPDLLREDQMQGARSSEGRSDDGDEWRRGSGLSSPGQETGQDDSAADLDYQAGPSGIAQQVGRAERSIEDRTDAEEAGREAGHVARDLLQSRYGLDDQPGPSELAQEVGRAEKATDDRDDGEEVVEADVIGRNEEAAVLHCLPTPAKEEEILGYMRELNSMPYEEPVKSLNSSFDLERFNCLRTAQPFQILPWLEIREIPEINGKGVFAKGKIGKSNIVSDYRSVLVPQHFVRDLQSSDQFTQEQKDLINDYVVDINARCHQKHKIEPLMKPMSFLDHRALYKGSVTLGRLFNHSAKHPNMKLAQYCELFATPQGPQPLIFAYLYAVREIQAGEQLLWNYGPTYTRLNLECICSKSKCKPNLSTSACVFYIQNDMNTIS
ncbi:unnamed protein product [Heligmosomoides polygyrus]|uniref:SET domain-containing protein n=1 Tax=Heligmosomoides polygyrus TaxID=6339 RepID=A0A183GH06_HELPZ|nr:unnamed protein product [Heligmosomoides polygyrus]